MTDIEAVRRYLAPHGIEVREFDRPTPSAESAALAVGCSVGEIAKTLLFFVGGEPLVVIAAGDRKVSSSLLKQVAGRSGKVRLPARDEVLALTGYPPGAVSPFLLPPGLPVYLDAALRRFSVVYPAAGTASSAAALTVDQLLELSAAQEVQVCVD